MWDKNSAGKEMLQKIMDRRDRVSFCIRIAILIIGIICLLFFIKESEYSYDIVGILQVVVATIFIGLLGLVNFKTGRKSGIVIREILLIVIAASSFLILDLVNCGGAAQSLRRIFINVVPIYMLERVLLMLTNSLKVTGIVTSALCFVLSIANYIVCIFRGRPIVPWDLTSLATVTTVAGEYTVELEFEIIWAFLLMMLIVQLVCMIQHTEKIEPTKKSVCRRICVNSLIVLCCFWGYKGSVYPTLNVGIWNMNQGFSDYGIIGGFFAQIHNASYSKPEGYTKEKAENILSQVKIEKADPAKTTAENIIVIMNESFADYRAVGDNALEGDYMPYIDSLTGNVLKGNLYVSTLGGGTANTEFEVLSGASCAYVPSTPYETLFNHEMDSIVSTLKENSYYAEAYHPYTKANWNRDEAYFYMGFDEYNALEDMEVSEADYVRWCISDYRDYQDVIKAYEENNDNRFFMFNVTMQNHGGYAEEYENFADTVDLSAYGEFKQAETYLSLVKESDKQLRMLIEYFSKVEEPTLICFFGDHQPGLDEGFMEMLIGKERSDWSQLDKMRSYITPVVLWSNYEMEPVNIDKISANYLGALILKQANITLSPYESFLWQLYDKYPVISAVGIIDQDGNYSMNKLSEPLVEYGWLQYHRLKK